jgi:hypothetical protein
MTLPSANHARSSPCVKWNRMAPPATGTRPQRALARSDFPDPVEPTMPQRSPRRITQLVPVKSVRSPARREASRSVTRGSILLTASRVLWLAFRTASRAWMPTYLMLGFLCSTALPSAISSSVAMTGIAHGNVAGAICPSPLHRARLRFR